MLIKLRKYTLSGEAYNIDLLNEHVNVDKVKNILEDGDISMLPKVEGDMSMWFDSFLQMVDLLMNMIHFIRTVNWDGYMDTLFEFLP